MNLDDLTEKQKQAIFKTFLIISANGEIVYHSAKMFLSVWAIRFAHENTRIFVDKVLKLSEKEMKNIIRDFDDEKKDELAYLWLKAATKMESNFFGMLCINDVPEYRDVIVKLSKLCNVDISKYLDNKVFINDLLV